MFFMSLCRKLGVADKSYQKRKRNIYRPCRCMDHLESWGPVSPLYILPDVLSPALAVLSIRLKCNVQTVRDLRESQHAVVCVDLY
jgi:hypothetical protein